MIGVFSFLFYRFMKSKYSSGIDNPTIQHHLRSMYQSFQCVDFFSHTLDRHNQQSIIIDNSMNLDTVLEQSYLWEPWVLFWMWIWPELLLLQVMLFQLCQKYHCHGPITPFLIAVPSFSFTWSVSLRIWPSDFGSRI